MRVAILGGGMAGVYTARKLHERGYEVTVFEAGPRVGGLCRSDVVDGFVYDVAGGHILHSRDPEILAEMVGVLEEPLAHARQTKIYYRGRYVKYPFENGLSDLPAEDNYQCLKGYLDAYIGRREGASEPTNFHDWIVWRFGEGMARHFMLPYNQKIWSVDLREVSTDWVRGRVPEAPLEDVLRAALGITTEGYTHQLNFYYPRRGGFEAIVAGFARGLEPRIRLSTPVRQVLRAGGRTQVNGESFDQVVNTLPLGILLDVLEPRPPEDVRDALAGLRHLSLTTVLVAVDRPQLSPYSWVYLPHEDNGRHNRITFLSNYSPWNAPPGKSSVLSEITSPGGSGPPDLAETERHVVEALERTGMLKADWVMFTRSFFNEYAYPVYDLGFKKNISRVLAYLDEIELLSLGRFARYRYVNTDQVVAMVREALATSFPPLV